MSEPECFVIPYCLFPDPPGAITSGRMLLLGAVPDAGGARLLTDVRNIYGRAMCAARCKPLNFLDGNVELVTFAPPDLRALPGQPWQWVLPPEDDDEANRSHERLSIRFLPYADLYIQFPPSVQRLLYGVYGYVSARGWL